MNVNEHRIYTLAGEKAEGEKYTGSLDRYAAENVLEPFSELIAELEEKRLENYLSIKF